MNHHSHRIIPLEASRGIAAVIVLLHHFFLAFSPYTTGFSHQARDASSLIGSALFVFVNGTGAVIFFFVLSGFVLTHAYFCSGNSSIIANGLAKRLPRLAGTVTLIIIISYLCFVFGAYYYKPAGALSGSAWLSTFGGAGLADDFQPSLPKAIAQGIITFFTGQAYYDSNLWTMKAEFTGSLVAFAVAPLLAEVLKFRLMPYLFSIFIFAASFIDMLIVPFLFGIFLSAALSRRKMTTNGPISIVLVVTGLYLLGYVIPEKHYMFLGPLSAHSSFIKSNLYVLLNSIGAVLLIFVLISNQKVSRLLDHKVGEFLGKISFPLYLMHILVICSISSYQWIALAATDMSFATKLTLTFGTTLAVSVVLSVLIARFDDFWVAMVNRVTKRIMLNATTPSEDSNKIANGRERG